MWICRHVIQRVAAGNPATRAGAEAGISRIFFNRWRRDYLRFWDVGCTRAPSGPGGGGWQSPLALEDAVLAFVLRCPTVGPQAISDRLRRRGYGGWAISPSGVYKILRRLGLWTRWERLARLQGAALEILGLVTKRTARRVLPHLGARKPGDPVSLDRFHIGPSKGVGRVWQLTACHAACSFEIAQVGVGAPKPAWTRWFLQERVLPVYQRAGYAVRAVLMDNGPEW